jgi:retron-type reverse transcriptase
MDGYSGPKLRPPLQDFEFLSKLLDVPQKVLARLTGVSKWEWGNRVPLYRVFFIPKRNGSSRIIHSPCDSLRWIQGLIKTCILDPAPVHSECVSAFRPGRSILHHSMQHAGKAVVIKMDLQDFFPSVTFPKVEQVFRKLGFAGAVARQLTLLTTTNLREGREMPEQIPPETQGLSRPETWRSLPQGAPTSPQLANMAAARLDLRLIGLCKSFGFHYSRYADDLTFSSPDSKAKASTLIRAVQQIVETSGFWVNPEKTRIMRATSTQKVTGLIVGSGQPRVPRKVMRRVRAMVHQSKTKDSFQEHNRLRGYLSFIKMINEDQFSKLKV